MVNINKAGYFLGVLRGICGGIPFRFTSGSGWGSNNAPLPHSLHRPGRSANEKNVNFSAFFGHFDTEENNRCWKITPKNWYMIPQNMKLYFTYTSVGRMKDTHFVLLMVQKSCIISSK